jgi:hypothetical protein
MPRIARYLVWYVVIAFASLLPISAQELRQPLTQGEVSHLLVNKVPTDSITKLAKLYRLGFQMTTDEEQQLIGLGASTSLITVLRELASPEKRDPKPEAAAVPAPAGMVVNSTTPMAEVYVNDIRMGRTGDDGLLKIPNVVAGVHHIRVSRDGFKDYTSDVELSSGNTVMLPVPELQKSSADEMSSLATTLREEKQSGNAKPSPAPEISIPFVVRDGFHVIGIPSLRRNSKVHLSVSTKYIFFSTDDRRLYKIPIDRIDRVEMVGAERYYAKTTYGLVVAFGPAGALMLAKKRKVDSLIIDYRNEKGGWMKLVMQVPQGMGTPCLERLAFGGISIGPSKL